MADTGKIATGGFGAGAITYVALGGFAPNPGGVGGVNACLVTMGFGAATDANLTLLGFAANPGAAPAVGGAGSILGGAILTGAPRDGWL